MINSTVLQTSKAFHPRDKECPVDALVPVSAFV